MSATDKSPSRKRSAFRPPPDTSVFGLGRIGKAPLDFRILASAGRRFFQGRLFARAADRAGQELCDALDAAAFALGQAEAARDRAERALMRTGWVYVDGAEEWRPPLGPDARPLIEAVDTAASAFGLLTEAIDVLGRHALGRRGPVAQSPAGFSVGDAVSKVGGDYAFDGEVRGVVLKRSGLARFVVEDDRGVLHIFSAKQLAPRATARSA